MSGEITLTGRILPVGGIKEKILAAGRAKVKTVLLPARNRVDVEELPAQVKREIDIELIDTVDDAMNLVLVKA